MSDMAISFENGDMVFGEQILSTAIRSDLIPVPLTAEIVLRANDELMARMQDGERFKVGEAADYFVAVLVEKTHVSGIQDGVSMKQFKVLALLDDVKEISFVAGRAVVLEKTTILSIYRAFGCKMAAGVDMPVERFSTFAGHIPSFMIMRCLQESAAILHYKDGQLSVLSLRQMIDKEADFVIASMDSTLTESGYLERHEIPIFASTNSTGDLVFGEQTSKTRAIKTIPKTDKLSLGNLSYALINKRTAKVSLNQAIRAGDCVQLDDAKYIVITALHFSELSGKNIDAYTQLWLGEISKT
jgi:hypothetical protein